MIKLFYVVYFFLIQLSLNEIGLANGQKYELDEETAFKKLLVLENKLKTLPLSRQNLFFDVFQSLASVNISWSCKLALDQYTRHLLDMKIWAIEMSDSSGNFPSSFLQGSVSSLGSYARCLQISTPSIRSNSNRYQSSSGRGKYCLATFYPPLPPRPKNLGVKNALFRRINRAFQTELGNEGFAKLLHTMYDFPPIIGICIPSYCEAIDLERLIQPMSRKFGLRVQVKSCEVDEPMTMDNTQTVIAVFLSVLILINVMATIFVAIIDVLRKERNEEIKGYVWKLCRCFDTRKNFQNLMEIKSSNKHPLDVTNGIRSFSLLWIMLGHSCLYVDRYLIRDPAQMEGIRDHAAFPFISNAFFAVETFLFTTGTLISFSSVSRFDQTKSFQPFTALVRRIYRLWPCLLLTMGLMFLLPLLPSGPLYKTRMEALIEPCRNNWYYNVLFLQNLLGTLDTCIDTTWYVAADLQLFLVSLSFHFFFFKSALLGRIVLGVATLASITLIAIITFYMQFPPTIVIYYVDVLYYQKFVVYIYNSVYTHVGPYGVGLFLGSYLARNPTARFSIPKMVSALLWVSAICASLSVILAVKPWNAGVPYTTLEAVTYSSLTRTVWAVCLAWLVFACFYGKAGAINGVLSWPGYQPFIKISYLTFLIHYLVLYYINESWQQPIAFTLKYLIVSFFGTLCISIIISAILWILFEAPMTRLEKLIRDFLQTRKIRKSDEIKSPITKNKSS